MYTLPGADPGFLRGGGAKFDINLKFSVPKFKIVPADIEGKIVIFGSPIF